MTVRKLFCISYLFFLCFTTCHAKVVYDRLDGNIKRIMFHNNTTYVLRYHHEFEDSLFIPAGCELKFKGGSLSGPIIFNETLLTGDVDLHGSTIGGSVANRLFDASWLCHRDGISDDALLINQILAVCNSVFFPKGIYNLTSYYSPDDLKDEKNKKAIHAHIGINKNSVSLKGEEGTVFVTEKPWGIITIYSKPYDIQGNVKNIKIDNIDFRVRNNGVDFHEPIYVIETIGVNGLIIKNCFFDDFWGDAICLSHYGDIPSTGERTRNQNVRILYNTIIGGDHHNNRNGISVINGKNVLIKGNVIKNTSRKDMPGGIDVEPNNCAYTIENIRIENNVFEEIRGSGGAICVVAFNDGPAHKVSIINNKIYNSNNGILLYVKTKGTTDGFLVKGNYVDRNTNPYRFIGSGASKNWTISGNTFDRPCKQNIPGEITVNNLTVKKNKKKD